MRIEHIVCVYGKKTSFHFFSTANRSFFRVTRPMKVVQARFQYSFCRQYLSAFAAKETSSSRPTPSRYGRGRYILEDCFLSSGSHIRHAKSLEKAQMGTRNIPSIDHNSRNAGRSPTTKRGESTSVIARHPEPNARYFSSTSRIPIVDYTYTYRKGEQNVDRYICMYVTRNCDCSY